MEKNRSKYLLKNTAIFALGSIGTKVISFFLVPLYTNILSTSEYGVVDLVTTICTVLAPILILNINEAIMRFSLDENANTTEIMSVGIMLLGMSFIGGLILIPMASAFPIISEYAAYLYSYTISLAGTQVFLGYLRGTERLVQYSIGNIIHALAIACFNIIELLLLKKGVQGYFIAYIAANIVTIIYSIFAGKVWEPLREFHLNLMLAKEMAKFSVVLIPNTFMWWIMNSSDRIMVTAMVGVAANGIYAISYKVPSLVQTATGIFNQAWSYSAIRENNSEDRDAYSSRVFGGVVAMSSIAGVGLLAVMKPFLRFYVEREYYSAWRYTPFLIVGFVFLTLGTFLSSYYTVNKDSKGFLFSGLTGAVANIILNAMLIPILGVTGAALATCISYTLVFLYRIFDTKKYVHLQFGQVQQWASCCMVVLAALTMFWDNMLGQVMQFVELGVLMLINRNIWASLLHHKVHQ